MASITVSGLGSGLDINNLVDQLVAVERDPVVKRLDTREAELQAKLSSYGTLKGSLSSLQNAASRLSSLSTFNAKSVSVSNSEKLGASASSIADAGTYSVEISQLAQSHSLATPSGAFSALTEVVGTGTLTFSFGTTDYDSGTDTYNGFTANTNKAAQQVTIADGTLSGIRDAVNEADIGVTASIVNDGAGYRLLFVSDDTGAESSLAISVEEDGGTPTNTDNDGLSRLAFNSSATNLEQTAVAQDAQLSINGLAISRANNTVTEAIHGVTLTLHEETAGTPVTVAVAANTESVSQAVSAFVAAYNDVATTLDGLSRYNTDTGESGILIGDASIRSIGNQLRRALGEAVPGLYGSYTSLASIGITTRVNSTELDDGTVAVGGTLAFDSSQLSQALSDDPAAVARLFAGDEDGLTGFADRLNSALDRLLNTGGVIDNNTESAQSAIADIADERIVLDDRMAALETRLRAQFTALDGLLSQLQNTSNFLTQQLASLPGFTKSNK
jgi:flagellar hook-associated protein 2